MSDKLHLIVPDAVLPSDAGAPAPALPPNLRALLSAMAPEARIEADEDSLSMPYEIAVAQALGLPADDGRIPWAAVESNTVATPCAWIKLCHWRVGADHVSLVPAEDLALDAASSQVLLAAMAPYFQEDGIALRATPAMPGTWLATGELFRGLPTLSMQRASAQRLTPTSIDTGGAAAATLRRLQNEMQMLLYTHPANDERQRQGLLPVNSFWVAGAGVLDRTFVPRLDVRVEDRLVQAARSRDAAAHAAAWQAVDADACASLLAVLRAGGAARLTLCGDRAAQSFVKGQIGVVGRFKRVLGLNPAWDGLQQL